MRVLVTGARGFIGSALTRALHEADWQVVVAVRQPDRGDNEVAVGDIYDRTRWQVALLGCDTIIHLAARVQTCLSHPVAANQTFLVSDGEDLSTADLLRRMGHALGKPARLFYVPPNVLKLGRRCWGKTVFINA